MMKANPLFIFFLSLISVFFLSCFEECPGCQDAIQAFANSQNGGDCRGAVSAAENLEENCLGTAEIYRSMMIETCFLGQSYTPDCALSTDNELTLPLEIIVKEELMQEYTLRIIRNDAIVLEKNIQQANTSTMDLELIHGDLWVFVIENLLEEEITTNSRNVEFRRPGYENEIRTLEISNGFFPEIFMEPKNW